MLKEKLYAKKMNSIKELLQKDIDKIMRMFEAMSIGKVEFSKTARKLNNLLRPGYEVNGNTTLGGSPLGAMAYKTICTLNFLGNASNCSWLNLVISKSRLTKRLPEDAKKEVNRWMSECEEIITDVLCSDISGFYGAAFINWADWFIQGCSCLKIDWRSADNDDGAIVFSNINMKDIFVKVENWGEFFAIAHSYSLPSDEAYRKFGNDYQPLLGGEASAFVSNQQVEFIDLCMKVVKSEPWAKDITTPYVRLLIDKMKRKIMVVSEEKTFPFIVSRTLSASHLPYGSSFLTVALSDLLRFNELNKFEHLHLSYSANPVLLESSEFNVEHLDLDSLKPGQIIRGLDSNSLRPMLQPMTPTGDLSMLHNAKQMEYASLVDQLLAADIISPNSGQRTTVEVQRLMLQWNQRILPLVESRKFDFLTPLIRRVLYLLQETNQLPPFPEYIIDGVNSENVIEKIGVVFGGQLKNMMQQQSLNDLITFLTTASQLNLGDFIDAKKSLDDIATYLGISPELVKTTEQVMEERQQQAQAMQQAKEEQEMQELRKTMALRQMNGKNAMPAV